VSIRRWKRRASPGSGHGMVGAADP
jgi:hypothetical protein